MLQHAVNQSSQFVSDRCNGLRGSEMGSLSTKKSARALLDFNSVKAAMGGVAAARLASDRIRRFEPDKTHQTDRADGISVSAKSPPLNSSGSPEYFARA